MYIQSSYLCSRLYNSLHHHNYNQNYLSRHCKIHLQLKKEWFQQHKSLGHSKCILCIDLYLQKKSSSPLHRNYSQHCCFHHDKFYLLQRLHGNSLKMKLKKLFLFECLLKLYKIIVLLTICTVFIFSPLYITITVSQCCITCSSFIAVSVVCTMKIYN